MQDKTIARLVGLLFVTTVIAGTIDSLVAIPLLGTSASSIVANRGQILLGVFLVLYMSMGIIGIALLLKPVLDRHNPVIASAYLSFRIVECVFLVVGVLVSLFLVAASQDPAMTGAPELLRLVNAQAVGIRMSAYQLAMAILGINSLGLCWALYVYRLVPRWISIIGFVGYALLFASAALAICGILDSTGIGSVLYIPGGIFELILFPGWLIVKGFAAR